MPGMRIMHIVIQRLVMAYMNFGYSDPSVGGLVILPASGRTCAN